MTTKERWEAFKAEARPYRMLLIWAAVAAVVAVVILTSGVWA